MEGVYHRNWLMRFPNHHNFGLEIWKESNICQQARTKNEKIEMCTWGRRDLKATCIKQTCN